MEIEMGKKKKREIEGEMTAVYVKMMAEIREAIEKNEDLKCFIGGRCEQIYGEELLESWKRSNKHKMEVIRYVMDKLWEQGWKPEIKGVTKLINTEVIQEKGDNLLVPSILAKAKNRYKVIGENEIVIECKIKENEADVEVVID